VIALETFREQLAALLPDVFHEVVSEGEDGVEGVVYRASVTSPLLLSDWHPKDRQRQRGRPEKVAEHVRKRLAYERSGVRP